MPTIPPPEKFDANLEGWEQYMDRVNYYFLANHVNDKDKLPTFFSLLSREVYNNLCQLLSPVHPSTKSFAEVVDTLNKYFKPRILVPVERFHFIRRKQEASESIKDFVKALRHLSTNCEYGDSVALDNRLCEQFVYGLRDSKIRSRLLLEEKFSFDDAIRISLSAELAYKGAEELKIESTSDNVFYHSHNKGKSIIHDRASKSGNVKCTHCGYSNHKSVDCKFKNATCHCCNVPGHIATICRKKNKKPANTNMASADSAPKVKSRGSRSVNALDVNSPTDSEDDTIVNFNRISINYANEPHSEPIMLDIKINNFTHRLQMDSGAAVSIIPLSFYKKFLNKNKLIPTKLVLNTLREKIKPLGKVLVSAVYKFKSCDALELYVIADPAICLIGLPWINKLNIINQLNHYPILPINSNANNISDNKIDKIISKFPKLFSEKLGTFKGITVKLSLKENAEPKFFKARPVPFAIRHSVEEELRKLEEQNIISPTQHSEWAAPLVVIRKKDQTLRLCGDYKVGVNQALNVNQYPLPVIDDIFTQLNGGKIFSKLDLSQAYQQLQMDKDSQSILTLNTHKGLFKVHRMPFGISPAPAIFQQNMDKLLAGLKGVICYLDDILVAGSSLEEHDSNLDAVLHQLEEAGITLNRHKCEFFKTQVEYLGHMIDSEGLHASTTKISSILEAPIPKDVPQLRSFLGLVGYYRKFLPNLSSVLAPLNALLHKDVKWHWSSAADTAFNQVKKEITSTKVLTHYDPKLPITLACDASPTGIGAVISHIFPDNSERPIAFASRSLSSPEKNYSQLDKEALGILFGVKRFHQFLFGRNFTLLTDHKPLTRIFGPKTEIPTLAAARLQRWALILSAYTYNIKFRSSKENANADALSRSPVSSIFKIESEEEVNDSLLLAHLDSFPINDKMIAKETSRDPILSQVLIFVRDGWPTSPLPKDFEPYSSRSTEITLQDGCLLWGLRVIIPSIFHVLILHELHRHHTGIVRMKMLARGYLWWPNLDLDIQKEAKSCPECTIHSNMPEKAPIHPWVWPSRPWERIHLDFAGPFLGQNFLIVVDAHSKWPEVFPMTSTTTEKTISILGNLFSHYGLPSQLVSDNGTQFTSKVFEDFIKRHGIRHSFSSPYHPSSNGQAERFVQTFKRSMKKSDSKLPVMDRINQLLYSYRSTPHTTTRQTPAFLFLGRQLRIHLDLLRPSVQKVVYNAQHKMILSRKDPGTTKCFAEGQKVIAREYLSPKKWAVGTIRKQLGPLTYQIQLPNGQLWKRHVDQLKDANLLKDFEESDVNLSEANSPNSSDPSLAIKPQQDQQSSEEQAKTSSRRSSNRPHQKPKRFT